MVKHALALVMVGMLAACGPAAAPAMPTATVVVSGPSALSVAVASTDFSVGQPRIPFVVFRGPQPMAAAVAVTITAYELSGGTPTPRWSGRAEAYVDYDIPYWVVYPELPKSGYWGLVADVSMADGTQETAQFTVEALAEPSAPAIGQVPPASRNRTLTSEPDLGLLTSDYDPEPGLYAMTVAEALVSGRPTVVTFATPAFCESRLCAPVVDSVKAVREDYADRANFIHIEVYKSFNPFEYADEMREWGLLSEPWTFVLDASGRVVERFGGPVSPRELAAALEPLFTQ
jgi:hypothetical protein